MHRTHYKYALADYEMHRTHYKYTLADYKMHRTHYKYAPADYEMHRDHYREVSAWCQIHPNRLGIHGVHSYPIVPKRTRCLTENDCLIAEMGRMFTSGWDECTHWLFRKKSIGCHVLFNILLKTLPIYNFASIGMQELIRGKFFTTRRRNFFKDPVSVIELYVMFNVVSFALAGRCRR
jgi:hypothetical protein